jgi:hypothetical protein
MKTIMKNKLSLVFSAPILVAMLVALSSCGKVPSSYQGTFVNQASGAKLELNGSEGKYTESTGRQLSAEAQSLQFDALLQAKAGLYMIPVQNSSKDSELVWIVPDAASRQEYPNVTVWYKAELLQSRINNETKDTVPSITIEHCMDGTVQLDLQSKTFIKGCNATAVPAIFTRVKQ